MAKKKQNSNLVGWAFLAVIALGIFHASSLGTPDRAAKPTPRAASSQSAGQPSDVSVPLNAPRFVSVASLNVRHAPSPNAELIMALPRGTQLRVLDRHDGWLLVDLNPTLEGWVTERFTTTKTPSPR